MRSLFLGGQQTCRRRIVIRGAGSFAIVVLIALPVNSCLADVGRHSSRNGASNDRFKVQRLLPDEERTHLTGYWAPSSKGTLVDI